MKTYYVIKEFWAIADLAAPQDVISEWTITRINVPPKFRGKGIGSQLLKLVLEDADKYGVNLVLEPYASGGLNGGLLQGQLLDWYSRHGFSPWKDGYLIRRPVRWYDCHFCGDRVKATDHHEKECRPDLFPHDIGDMCTWPGRRCYWDHVKNQVSAKGMIALT